MSKFDLENGSYDKGGTPSHRYSRPPLLQIDRKHHRKKNLVTGLIIIPVGFRLIFLIAICGAELSSGKLNELRKERAEAAIKWAPLIWLHPKEKYFPSAVHTFLKHASPRDIPSHQRNSEPPVLVPMSRSLDLRPLPEGEDGLDTYLVVPLDTQCKNCPLPSFLYGEKPTYDYSPPVYATITSCLPVKKLKKQNLSGKRSGRRRKRFRNQRNPRMKYLSRSPRQVMSTYPMNPLFTETNNQPNEHYTPEEQYTQFKRSLNNSDTDIPIYDTTAIPYSTEDDYTQTLEEFEKANASGTTLQNPTNAAQPAKDSRTISTSISELNTYPMRYEESKYSSTPEVNNEGYSMVYNKKKDDYSSVYNVNDGYSTAYTDENDGYSTGYTEEDDGYSTGYTEENDGYSTGYTPTNDGYSTGYTEENDGFSTVYADENDEYSTAYTEGSNGYSMTYPDEHEDHTESINLRETRTPAITGHSHRDQFLQEQESQEYYYTDHEFTVTYWMFYPYSEGKEVCTSRLWLLGRIFKPRLKNKCFGEAVMLNSHIGDWEHISIYFKNGEPERMYVSTHTYGAFYHYNKRDNVFHYRGKDTRMGLKLDPKYPLFVKLEGTHPIVYASLGSHGFWASPGNHRYENFIPLEDKTAKGTAWKSWKNIDIIDYREDDFDRPDRQWLNYNGKWGNPSSGCHRALFGTCDLASGPTGIPLKRQNFPCSVPNHSTFFPKY